MVQTYYCRSATGHTLSNGVYNYDLEPTTTTPSVNNFGEAGSGIGETWYYSSTSEPNSLTWTAGTWTWYLNITTANSSLHLTAVVLRRTTSALADRSTKTSTFDTILSSTGVLSGTIDWSDGTQNPGGSSINDRLVVTFQFTRDGAAMGTQSSTHGVNLITDSRVDSPLGTRNLTQTISDSITFTDDMTQTVIKPTTVPSTNILLRPFIRYS